MKLQKWQKSGLVWGLWMFVIMTFVWPYFDGEEITLRKTLISLVIWTIASFAFGWSMRHNHKEK
ncbi:MULTISPECIES: hypothetical protein [Tenacibaculum]|uniref:hypothetical protein n=1 Tax=Tenacibaculum TaxID=104267 RepID=UPI0021AEDAA8|nr:MULTISPECIES: hypothetical protein [Tenacibaculum]MCT4699084.1 hypothetical protein [Tenacibaculum haliotis]WBX71796.1 hypothetical protein PG912_03150 [Tenacibaculum retecalamus]